MLAESATPDSSGRSWTVHLRKGVKSQYGNELSAADVAFSWQRSVGLKASGAYEWGVLAKVTKVVAIDASPARIVTNGPSPAFKVMLALAQVPIYDSTEVKKHITKADPWAAKWLADHSAGYGPYVLKSWTKGQSMTFEARDDYYGAKPGYKTIKYIAI